MAYENIDTMRLRQAINDCLNTLSSSKLSEVSNSLTDDVWQGSSKSNIKTAINTLASDRYKALIDKLNSYLTEVDKIEQYQSTDSSIDSLQSQKTSKTAELNKEKSKTPQNKTKINELQTEINSLTSQINSKQSEQNNISINL